MANLELEKYVANARAQGAADDAIKAALLKSGWLESDILEALSPHPAGVDLPPPPVPRFGMWVSFQHIIFFITLYISATSLAGILFDVVNRWFPDKLSSTYLYYGGDYSSTLLHGYIAALMVAFPIFVIFYYFLEKQLLKNPGVRNIKSRKFLIYATMVIAFITMVVDLITDIFGYLQGSETMQSVGHSVVIILIAGSIFVWLLFQVKEDRKLQ